MAYHFNDIEAKWQKYWAENKTFKAKQPQELGDDKKEPFYVLDMFPYPSGAGLHVGHPLGYIASDIYARFKRHQGYNVLHPQGYDSFGLPAEQYAIQTGQHPAKTTKANIKRYREQLDRIGFSFDWDREVRTSNPEYYKWTQWIFIQLFESYYCNDSKMARPISELEELFHSKGNFTINAACDEDVEDFSADDWNAYTQQEKERILLKYRLTYLAETEVNWCPALGTVLANDEIVNGLSERGGHPVERKKMKQWSMRISAYAERLLEGLNSLEWSDSIKESQRNWIGKSVGALIEFKIQNSKFKISAFTTRPDTIFGVSFMTLAPELDLVLEITTSGQKEAVEAYIKETAKRSERDRLADVKSITGVFTGAYAEHPFTKEPIPIWIGDYVLAGYGTGAVMAVPCGDQRDYDFAKHFDIPIPNIFKDTDISKEAFGDKDETLITDSDFLNDLPIKKAISKAIEVIEEKGIGASKTNYRLRDAVFSRQRYWGEPFPVYYVDGLPKMIESKHLPLKLPEVEKYLPTETGEPPLGRADVWAWDTINNQVVDNKLINGKNIFPLELNTMPGWAGSSWYMFRYMETEHRDKVFASQEALEYWQNVDFYVGGSEHATGHLLYSRFWTKFLKDRGHLKVDEPFKKMLNQGMILGESAFTYVLIFKDFRESIANQIDLRKFSNQESKDILDFIKKYNNKILISSDIANDILSWLNISGQKTISTSKINEYFKSEVFDKYIESKIRDGIYPQIVRQHADVNSVNASNELDIEGFKKFRSEFKDAEFIRNSDGVFKVSREVEKMSKSKYNVVNPDDVCDEYGADALRLFEMFLGPIDQAKPWNTAGLSGVLGFLKKLWKLYHSGKNASFYVTDSPPSEGLGEALKTLHKTIKKVTEDIEAFSFNTSVSTFMICVNELTQFKCNQREILEPLCILISPFAPHIAEELWEKLGYTESITYEDYPVFEEKYLVESTKVYPISFNGKMKYTLELDLSLSKEGIEKIVMSDDRTKKQLGDRKPKKVIIVPGKIVNIVG